MRTASFRDNAGLNTGPKQFYRLLRGNQDDFPPSVKMTPLRFEQYGRRVNAQTCGCNISPYYLLMQTVAQKMTL